MCDGRLFVHSAGIVDSLKNEQQVTLPEVITFNALFNCYDLFSLPFFPVSSVARLRTRSEEIIFTVWMLLRRHD